MTALAPLALALALPSLAACATARDGGAAVVNICPREGPTLRERLRERLDERAAP